MRFTTLSYLLILGIKIYMFCFLLVCGGHKCENHVREFAKGFKFVNMLKIAH